MFHQRRNRFYYAFFQVLGAAAPRIFSQAIIRDLFLGRSVAKLISIVMVIFVLTPAFGPLYGELKIPLFSWRGVFQVFINSGCRAKLVFYPFRRKTTCNKPSYVLA